MKILAKHISVLAYFKEDGAPRQPLRLTLNDEELKIEQIISVTEERLAGNRV